MHDADASKSEIYEMVREGLRRKLRAVLFLHPRSIHKFSGTLERFKFLNDIGAMTCEDPHIVFI